MVRNTPTSEKITGFKKGTWTPEEDKKLVDHIAKYGYSNWRQLPKYAGLSRCGKSCRLRWMNYLRPNVKRGNYTKEEEEIIIKLHESLGNRWSTIASHLSGRTDNDVKNHWHTYLKRKIQKKTVSLSKHHSYKITHDNISNPNVPLLDPKIHQILESYPLSPQTSLSDLSSSTLLTECSSTKQANFVAEDDAFSTRMFEVDSSDFWTEPFLTDNCNVGNDFNIFTPLSDAGIFSPLSPIIGVESLYGLCDEELNVFY